jgi:hypothetical protein
MGWVHVAALLLVAGCSATPFTTAAADAAAETGPSDAASDAQADALADAGACGPQGPQPDSVCMTKMSHLECNDCCRCGHAAGAATFLAGQAACVCGAAGACQSECATTLCADAGVLTPSCANCVTTTREGGACASEEATCAMDPSCQAFVDCTRLCDQDR